MYKIRNNQKGFTLLEMLVSIFIIALISTIFMANYRSYGRKSELRMTAQKLASDIRKMQNYSLGLKEYNGSFPEGGWGIYLTTQVDTNNLAYYILFRDGESNKDHVRDSNGNEDYLDKLYLPKNYSIQNIFVTPAQTGPQDRASLVFEPPDPYVWICRRSQSCDDPNNPDKIGAREIEFNIDNGAGDHLTLHVNRFGLIDIKN